MKEYLGVCGLENFGTGMKGKPGEPESLDSGNFLAAGIGDGDASIFCIPCKVKLAAVDGIAETGFTLLVEFDEWVCLEHAVNVESDYDFLGMIVVRCFIVDREIGIARLFITGVGIALVIARMPGVIG